MTTTVDSVLNTAARVLGDETNEHWPAPTLLDAFNEAQSRIASDVPGAYTLVADVTMVAGARQTLPIGGIIPLDIANIRRVDKRAIDRENPAWQGSVTASNTTTMWARDPNHASNFYVYPPRTGTPGTLADVEYSATPAKITLGDPITLDEAYVPAIVDFIVYRGLSEDRDLADPVRATHFLTEYKTKIGVAK